MERTIEEVQNDISENLDILNSYIFDVANAQTEQERIEANRQVQMYQSALYNLYDELGSLSK